MLKERTLPSIPVKAQVKRCKVAVIMQIYIIIVGYTDHQHSCFESAVADHDDDEFAISSSNQHMLYIATMKQAKSLQFEARARSTDTGLPI